MRLLGKRYGFYPNDAKQAWDVDATGDYVAECQDLFTPVAFKGLYT